MGKRPRALFLGSTFAGHRTRFANLRAHVAPDDRLESRFVAVEGWREGGLVERSPVLSREVRGRARAILSSRALATLPRPDLIWSSAAQPLLPHLWSQVGPFRRPLVLDLDWTFELQESMAPIYYSRATRSGWPLRFGLARERALWRAVSMFTPWSNWAADSLRRQGVPSHKIRVLPPGIDLADWQPSPNRWQDSGPLRVLFVGGDFVRKGGDLLLKAAALVENTDFDIVTPEPVTGPPNVHVHQAGPNSPALKRLFAQAHVFVLPSRADCFGLATVEAMASGLPAIVTDVGGARDIVEEGVTGWLIAPKLEDLVTGLRQAADDRERLRAMGEAGRMRAERLFDGERNDRAIVDLMLELVSAADERGMDYQREAASR